MEKQAKILKRTWVQIIKALKNSKVLVCWQRRAADTLAVKISSNIYLLLHNKVLQKNFFGAFPIGGWAMGHREPYKLARNNPL